MRKPLAALAVLSLGLATALLAHDMFLKLGSYFLAENTAVTIPLLNGTFSTSENSIDRNRIVDISLVSPAGRQRFDTATVTARGDSTFFPITTGPAGTYVFGVSTRPNRLKISGKEFNGYLAEEGLTEVVAARTRAGISGDSASERYSKHVKAIFQVGQQPGDGYATVLGYPAELVPLENPYTRKTGDPLRFKALVGGRPVAGVTLLAGGRMLSGARLKVQTVRTGGDGVATIRLRNPGLYYVKFISIVKQTGGDADYESNWATVTFQVR